MGGEGYSVSFEGYKPVEKFKDMATAKEFALKLARSSLQTALDRLPDLEAL
jgi:hypothetical protein